MEEAVQESATITKGALLSMRVEVLAAEGLDMDHQAREDLVTIHRFHPVLAEQSTVLQVCQPVYSWVLAAVVAVLMITMPTRVELGVPVEV